MKITKSPVDQRKPFLYLSINICTETREKFRRHPGVPVLDSCWGRLDVHDDVSRVLLSVHTRFVGLDSGLESTLSGRVLDHPVQSLGISVPVAPSDIATGVSLFAPEGGSSVSVGLIGHGKRLGGL
ncbi:hypothetical protein CDAR_375921 [Caerostris darwini]|uniref:Uncharacterized protein n=1 Tax=Caerostris darwini TaxID=1538125 RepID=A0AAV4SB69_9ARAC|nr:hypothetical protein CDAR_375921 [Caerostris darwini]